MFVKCTGEAHRNPHIDHCAVCMPRWGWVVRPTDAADRQLHTDVARALRLVRGEPNTLKRLSTNLWLRFATDSWQIQLYCGTQKLRELVWTGDASHNNEQWLYDYLVWFLQK